MLKAEAARDFFNACHALDHGLICSTHLASLTPDLDFVGSGTLDHRGEAEIANIGIQTATDSISGICPVAILIGEVSPLRGFVNDARLVY